MRSIPQAMIWEMWRHKRLPMLAGALGANLLPVLLFAALQHDGAIDPRDSSQIVMQIVLLQINLFVFAAATFFSAQEGLTRLYALPVATTTLVTWRLLPMMAAVGLESAVSTAALNAAFGLDWPIWGPALYGVAWAAALAAALWITENTAWVVVALTVAPAPLGLWFKARYGGAFSQPTRVWHEVTFVEVATMLTVVIAAYCVAVAGVARSRRRETLPSLGIIAWLNRLFDPAPYAGRPFRSASAAQAWAEWRAKGLLMPAAALFGAVFGTALCLLTSSSVEDLIHGLLVGGGLLSVVALLGGLIVGNCGPDDANYGIGSFLGTRPMTNTALARIILQTAAKSIFIAWLIWAADFAVVYGVVWARQGGPPALPRGLTAWYFPATLIGAWTITGVMTFLGLTGRPRLVVGFICALVATSIGVMLFGKLALTRDVREQLFAAAISAGAVLAIVLTVWTYAAARRRGLIGRTTIYVAASLWAALAALIALADVWHAAQSPALYVSLMGVGALALAPLAAAPLALASNRTR